MTRTILWILCAAPAGCVIAPPDPPALLATSLDDRSDRVSPSAPILLRFSSPPDPATVDQSAVCVVRGAADDALTADLANPPLDPAHQAQIAAGELTVDGAEVWWRPLAPLAPDALHTLVVTPRLRARGAPLPSAATRAFLSGPASSGAPTWSIAEPVDGQLGVVRNLRQVELAFSRPVAGVDASDLLLIDQAGIAAPAAVAPGGCPSCFTLAIGAVLDAGVRYTVVARAPIADGDGEPPFSLLDPPGFTAGDAIASDPPAIEGLTSDAADGCLVARWTTDRAASGRLCAGAACVEAAALTAPHELALPLAGDPPAWFTVASRDDSTAPAAAAGPLESPAQSDRAVSITEVLARPLGSWPAHQFVELYNRGDAPVDLGGLELHDEQGFDVLPPATLAPGAYALVVPSEWTDDDGLDAAPPEGTLIVRLADDWIGGNGVRETGEALALVEPDGRLASRFSTYGASPLRGQSVVRALPCDVEGAFQESAGGATPGGP